MYNDRVHDKGEKIVLGVTIPAGGGKDDAEKVLDILARSIRRRRGSFRRNWRSASSRTIRRRRWWIAWRRLSATPTATSAR